MTSRRALFDDLAGIHENDAVGDLAGEAHLVGNHDHRHPGFRQLADYRQDLADQFRIESRVGSSNSIRRGEMASARAIATRCCWPPESRCGK